MPRKDIKDLDFLFQPFQLHLPKRSEQPQVTAGSMFSQLSPQIRTDFMIFLTSLERSAVSHEKWQRFLTNKTRQDFQLGIPADESLYSLFPINCPINPQLTTITIDRLRRADYPTITKLSESAEGSINSIWVITNTTKPLSARLSETLRTAAMDLRRPKDSSPKVQTSSTHAGGLIEFDWIHDES